MGPYRHVCLDRSINRPNYSTIVKPSSPRKEGKDVFDRTTTPSYYSQETCSISGCTRKRSNHSHLCMAHIMAKRRHGHPLQIGIRATNLRPHRERLQQWINTQPNAEAIWEVLARNLKTAADVAAGVLRRYEHGEPVDMNQKKAAEDITRVVYACYEDPEMSRRVVLTVMSIVLLYEEDPLAFRCHQAFVVQTARQWIRLIPAYRKQSVNPKTGRVGYSHAILKPPYLDAIGRWLIAAFAPATIQIKVKWKAELAALERNRQDLDAVLNGATLDDIK